MNPLVNQAYIYIYIYIPFHFIYIYIYIYIYEGDEPPGQSSIEALHTITLYIYI